MELYSLISNVITTILSPLLPQRTLRNLTIFFLTLPRDLKFVYTAIKIITKVIVHLKILNKNAVSVFNGLVRKHPNKVCFLFQDEVWSYKEVDEYSNRIAQIFLKAGLKKGDVVALVVSNRPEYCCIWMGLAKIGVISALINTNLRNQPLVHCITASSSTIIIYSSDLADAVQGVRNNLDGKTRFYQLGRTAPKAGAEGPVEVLDDLLPTVSSRALPIIISSNSEHLFYIYTSGTTGLPKAAIVPHNKFIMVAQFGWQLLGLRPDDIVYNPLPLYHSAGGMIGAGAALGFGATTVLKPKFSASAFIPDCIRYRCTAAQYIGEICRYVLAVPEKPTDVLHNLRLVVGNGLKPLIWEAFVKRFRIPNVRELYGSTEGNLTFLNLDNKIGSVGIIPRFMPFTRQFGIIIKVDVGTMEPIRGPDGLCIECATDEPGMFVGLIPKRKSPMREFHGYLDKQETKNKYIYNVLKKGDRAFMSGDLMVLDELGYLYFKDRTGDTFRWKGENVATSEVEAVISNVIGLRDCIVYGVQVGDLEGRAGMAAIADPEGQVDLLTLPAVLDKLLPRYAQPVFIRIIKEAEMTGTFKIKKINLIKEGFDLSIVKDPLFLRKGPSYVPVTKELIELIVAGKLPV